MDTVHSFSHTDLALELKEELAETIEKENSFTGIKVQREMIGNRGLQETIIEIENESEDFRQLASFNVTPFKAMVCVFPKSVATYNLEDEQANNLSFSIFMQDKAVS